MDGEWKMSKDSTNKTLEEFEALVKPVIKWMAENVHPHHTLIITNTHAELLEGQISVQTSEYLND